MDLPHYLPVLECRQDLDFGQVVARRTRFLTLKNVRVFLIGDNPDSLPQEVRREAHSLPLADQAQGRFGVRYGRAGAGGG